MVKLIPKTGLGLPYKGGKRRIAREIIDLLPTAGTFYDMFAGGCSVTHAALLSGKYGKAVSNDIWGGGILPRLFKKALIGHAVDKEPLWFSRSQFFGIRKSPGYIRNAVYLLAYSFSNDMRSYIYPADVAQWYEAAHAAAVYGETMFLDRLAPSLKPRFHDAVETAGGNWRVAYLNLQRVFKECDTPCRISPEFRHLSTLSSIERLKSPQLWFHTECSGRDYREVEISSDSVIYCDPPYPGTSPYPAQKCRDAFDYSAFLDWTCRQQVPTLISGRYVPDDRFVELARTEIFTKRGDNCNRYPEVLFTPRNNPLAEKASGGVIRIQIH